MEKIAAYLIEKETITGKEFMKIYREAKGLPEPEEEKKDSESKEEANEVDSEQETATASTEEKTVEIKMHEETNAYVPTPEEVRNNSQIQQPDYQQYSWQQNVPQNQPNQLENNAQSDHQKEEPQHEEENSEVSKFGSAWDQNVNGRK